MSTKNNFNIPNYIHLSYQGYLDDKMNTKKKVQAKTTLKAISRVIHKSFKNTVGMDVEQYLEEASSEIESMKAMIALFSGEGIEDTIEKGGNAVPFSELWNKYKKQVEQKINSMGLSSESAQYLLDYTQASASVSNLSIALKLLQHADNLKSIQNYLLTVTQDFDKDLVEQFHKDRQNKNSWAHLVIQQVLKEALIMEASLDNLNSKEAKNLGFGQNLNNIVKSLKKQIEELNRMYASGKAPSQKAIEEKVQSIRRYINTNIKGVGTETVSLVNIPSVRLKAKDTAVELLHSGLSSQLKTFKEVIEFERSKPRSTVFAPVATVDAKREVKLADVTINLINKEEKQSSIRVSRKMYSIKSSQINLGDLSIAQANAMMASTGLDKYVFMKNKNAFTFLSAMNFLLSGRNFWYKKEKGRIKIVQDNGRKNRAIGSFSSLPKTQRTLDTEIISSFLGAVYGSFFLSDYSAFYDIGNFVVPSPLMFDYSIERIARNDLKTGITSFIGISSSKEDYQEKIRTKGSGFKGVIKKGKKHYPFEILAVKRNKAAIVGIGNTMLKVKSYNITNQQYYYDMFNKIKR